jgi:putative hemolysin
MEIVIILLLILLNGFFAMAEIAIISSRKSRLQQMANTNNAGAQGALELAEDPNKFISTIQVGITLVGVFAGAFGGATIADIVAKELNTIPLLKPYSHPLALGIVVVVITYLSLIGELIPKKIALSNSEKIAALVSRPMHFFSVVSKPLLVLINFSTDFFFRFFKIDPHKESSVSEEEVQLLISEGAQSGVFEAAEKDIIERTLRLDDKKANSLMTTRSEVVWLDVTATAAEIRSSIIKNPYSYFPVCRESLDDVVGIIRSEELLTRYLAEERIDLHSIMHKPLFIPESMDALNILELFKKSGIRMAIVIDEYGSVLGVTSLNDILEAIVGDIPTANEVAEKEIIQRDENSWLIDGLTTLDDFKDYFGLTKKL